MKEKFEPETHELISYRLGKVEEGFNDLSKNFRILKDDFTRLLDFAVKDIKNTIDNHFTPKSEFNNLKVLVENIEKRVTVNEKKLFNWQPIYMIIIAGAGLIGATMPSLVIFAINKLFG